MKFIYALLFQIILVFFDLVVFFGFVLIIANVSEITVRYILIAFGLTVLFILGWLHFQVERNLIEIKDSKSYYKAIVNKETLVMAVVSGIISAVAYGAWYLIKY